MALSREETLAIGAGAVAVIGVIALSRRPSGPGDLAIAVTGPSEATGRELIRAGVESQRISATLERDLADIYGSTLVDLTALDVRREISLATTAATERIRGKELGAEVQIAGLFSETQKFLAQTQVQAIRAQQEPAKQSNLFDFILDIAKAIFRF